MYEFNRNTAYNANDYFLKRAGKPRTVFQLNIPGGNIGGPLYIPHVYNEAKNRTFFFWNEEWRKLIKGSSPSVSNNLWTSTSRRWVQDYNYTPQSPSIPIVPNPVPNGLPNNASLHAIESGQRLTPGSSIPVRFGYRNLHDSIRRWLTRTWSELTQRTCPKPNTGCTGIQCTQYVISVNQPENIREDVVRIDHSINSRFQLMGHYLHDAMENTFFPPLMGR